MHDVFRGIGDERVSNELTRPGIPAIYGQAAGRRKIAGSASSGLVSLLHSLDSPPPPPRPAPGSASPAPAPPDKWDTTPPSAHPPRCPPSDPASCSVDFGR